MTVHRGLIVGVDTGGTFTDLVLHDGGRVVTHKTPSTPDDYSRGILRGIEELLERAGGAGRDFTLVHSSTVATNALLERKGARTALVTTEGFEDVLELARQTRPALYDLAASREPALIPRSLRLGVPERVTAEGKVLRALDLKAVDAVCERLAKRGIESLAVCLLYSFLNPAHERLLARRARRPGIAISLSSEVLPEFREYERTSTTVINAYVQPVMTRYLGGLSDAARKLGMKGLRIMHSGGGALSRRAATERPVRTLLSGPAAGVIGAISMAGGAVANGRPQRQRPDAGALRLITFDMGGTSTDVSLIAGGYQVTSEGMIGGLPVRAAMIDIHTVGAGGGSIAYLDGGGALHVGPRSAGADPGPACYGRGEEPTVTDANLVAGRIAPEHFLGGRMVLDARRAQRAIGSLARKMKASVPEAAEAILRIVNSNMRRAIRVISEERGHDPGEFTLFSFGGAGGLHACDLAESLGIPGVMIPRHPGVLSAWGAIAADVIKDFAQTVMLPGAPESLMRLDRVVKRLSRQAVREMNREGFGERRTTLLCSLDMRYVGQSYELNVPYAGRLPAAAQAFHLAHAKRYGHAHPAEPLQIVTVRVRAIGPVRKPMLDAIARGNGDSRGARIRAAKGNAPALYDRKLLRAGDAIAGPTLVVEDFATTLIPRRWRASVDRLGHLRAMRK